MIRRFCIIRKFTRSSNPKETNIYFNDIDSALDTIGCYGYEDFCNECYRVPFSLLEVVNILGTKCFYNKSEFLYDDSNELLSIKCGNRFLCVKPQKREFSALTQKEINRLMKLNF